MSEKEEFNIWRSKITPSTRGAIFRAKRWFYATFYNKGTPKDKRERSKINWVKLARMLVERSNKEGITDNGARLIIHYKIEDSVFVPKKAEIEVYDLKPLKKVTVEM